MASVIYNGTLSTLNQQKSGVQEKCVITFIVEKDGKISDARITQDFGEGCGEESYGW